ncbi:BQ5605_C002g01597 [Microbotryum silenes-dioicae]|uniref:BQ5605_C002g01597 protein n=1 Tax=Microbotryum silenes-dioicae TaxID=796604 RepID=A0A2X0MTZ2_9BASI|nr:BQ5605_C002g01597 [Microbotryum silenes-dioicae]
MSFRRGNLIFSGLGLIFLPLNILFLPRASQLALITLGFTRTGVRVTAISVIITFLLLFRAPFEFQIVELLRTARFLEDPIRRRFRPPLRAEFSIHIIGVIVIDRHWDRVTDCCRQKTPPKVRMEIGQDE